LALVGPLAGLAGGGKLLPMQTTFFFAQPPKEKKITKPQVTKVRIT